MADFCFFAFRVSFGSLLILNKLIWKIVCTFVSCGVVKRERALFDIFIKYVCLMYSIRVLCVFNLYNEILMFESIFRRREFNTRM